MRALLASTLLASVVAKDSPTLVGRPGTAPTTGWCHPGFARNVDVDAAFFETTGEHKSSCIACPAGQHSQGGIAATCTPMADEWATCSHLACELVESETHCNFHNSSNPKTDLARATPLNAVAKVASSCHDVAGVQRISIFHHGSEQNGMEHQCSKNTGGVNGARGACECKCKRGFDYADTPTERVETTMSLGGFTEATFTDHAQFAVQTAIAADLGVDVTHVTISNIQYSTDGGLTWFDVSVGGRRLTEVQKKIRFDVNVKVTAEQKSTVSTKVNEVASEPAAQATLVATIQQVMVNEHINTDNLELTVACQEVVPSEIETGFRNVPAFTGTHCSTRSFRTPFSSVPKIVVSVSHEPDPGAAAAAPGAGAAAHDKIGAWTEWVSATQFRFCVREFTNDNSHDENAQVQYVGWTTDHLGSAIASSITTPTKAAGRQCDTVTFPEPFDAVPTVVASIDHSNAGVPHTWDHDAIFHWVEGVTATEFKVCTQEGDVFDGTHGAVNINYIAAPQNKASAYFGASGRGSYIGGTTGQFTGKTCQRIPFGETFTRKPNVMVTLTHVNTSSTTVDAAKDGVVTWVQDITQVDFRVCAEEPDSYDNVHYGDTTVDWVAFHDTSPGAYHLMLGGTSNDAVRLYGAGAAKPKPDGVCSVDTRTTGDYTNAYGNDIGVQCCDALTGTSGSRPGCKKSVTFDDAEQHCAAYDKVLCSQGQIAAGAGSGTGCSFDAFHVWTRDFC